MKVILRVVVIVLMIQQDWVFKEIIKAQYEWTEGDKELMKSIITLFTLFRILWKWKKPHKGIITKLEEVDYYRFVMIAVVISILTWLIGGVQTLPYSLAIWGLPIVRGAINHLETIMMRWRNCQMVSLCFITIVQICVLCWLYRDSLLVQILILLLGILAICFATDLDYAEVKSPRIIDNVLDWGADWNSMEAIVTSLLLPAMTWMLFLFREKNGIMSETIEEIIRLSMVADVMLPRGIAKYAYAELRRRNNPIKFRARMEQMWEQRRENRAMKCFILFTTLGAVGGNSMRANEEQITMLVIGLILGGIFAVFCMNEKKER